MIAKMLYAGISTKTHTHFSKAESKILFVCPLPTYPQFSPLLKKLYCSFVRENIFIFLLILISSEGNKGEEFINGTFRPFNNANKRHIVHVHVPAII